MNGSNVVPIRSATAYADWTQGLEDAAVQQIKCAARENIDLLRSGVNQCIHIALEGSKNVAVTMIDYAIELNSQTRDATRRYGVAADRWERLG